MVKRGGKGGGRGGGRGRIHPLKCERNNSFTFHFTISGFTMEKQSFLEGVWQIPCAPKRLHTACFTTVAPPMIVGGCSMAVVLWLPLEYYQWFRNGGGGGGGLRGPAPPLNFKCVCMCDMQSLKYVCAETAGVFLESYYEREW